MSRALVAGFIFGFTLAGCIGGDPFTSDSSSDTTTDANAGPIANPDRSDGNSIRSDADSPEDPDAKSKSLDNLDADAIDASDRHTWQLDAETLETSDTKPPTPDDASISCIPVYQKVCCTPTVACHCILSVVTCS